MEHAVVVLKDAQGQPHQVFLDAQDLPLIDAYIWAIRHRGYAACKAGGKSILLHRLIMSPKPGELVDHITGNTLDNRRANLRICTSAQNSKNQLLRVDNTSGFKGVRRHTSGAKWEALIKHNGKRHYLGLFDDPRVAAHAYNRAAIQLHGEFACLNPL